MSSNKVIKLAAAIAAAALLGTSAASAQTFDLNGPEVVLQLASYVEDGDVSAATALIDQLQALGVEQFVIDGRVVSLAELRLLLADGITPAELQLIMDLLDVADGVGDTTFIVAGLPQGTITTDDTDIFPTGSAG